MLENYDNAVLAMQVTDNQIIVSYGNKNVSVIEIHTHNAYTVKHIESYGLDFAAYCTNLACAFRSVKAKIISMIHSTAIDHIDFMEFYNKTIS